MMMLFTILAVIIGASVAVPIQHANGASNDDSMTSYCKNHPSDTSKKCSKNDTPLILPFP
jgi:hypothetical protein